MRLHRLLRNRAIGLARRAVAPVTAWRVDRRPPTLRLEAVSRRLELLLAAMYGRRLSVGPLTSFATAPVPPDVALPPLLDARDGHARAMTRYRLLAIEQAARVVRGTHAQPLPADPLTRDLYLLAEGATIDRTILRQAPGLANDLRALRRAELAQRQALARTPPAEREAERLLQALLASEPDDPSAAIAEMESPAASAEWARGEAERIRARTPLAARHRGLQAIGLWGTGLPESGTVRFAPPFQGLWLRRTESEEPSPSGEGSESAGGQRAGRPDDRGEGDDVQAGGGDERREDAASGPASTAVASSEPAPAPGGITYREWDEYAGRYREDEVTVQARVAAGADESWAIAALRAHAPLVRQVRARFAPLRAQRARLRAQRAGDELDLDACVAALVEMRRGHLPDDRLYRLTRPARRTLAIMLLVDVSGSTKAALADGRTVLEVERMTLLLASEALDELGDPYAALAFSSSGRHDVQVDTVKAFADTDPSVVRRRISALAAARNTRLGAALRHATAVLNAQRAERRLLLLLSDGQPNDVGGYQGSYAVADSRRAVLEARASGVHPFCLTVDREEQEYLPHLFGTNGYRVLRDPAQLPAVLLEVVTHLLPA